jgi:hypothetical protein
LPAIRTKVIGVFQHGDRILVGDAYDRVKQQVFYCPPVDVAHGCRRGVFGLFGKLPKPDGKW